MQKAILAASIALMIPGYACARSSCDTHAATAIGCRGGDNTAVYAYAGSLGPSDDIVDTGDPRGVARSPATTYQSNTANAENTPAQRRATKTRRQNRDVGMLRYSGAVGLVR